MVRVLSSLLGPEGLWLLIAAVTYFVSASNQPATPSGNDLLETLWTVIPLIGIPLTFLTAYLPGGGGWWWLFRVAVVSCVGVVVASAIAAGGVDYHDSRNSGLMTAPFYSLTIGLFVLIPCAAVAAGIMWRKGQRGSRDDRAGVDDR